MRNHSGMNISRGLRRESETRKHFGYLMKLGFTMKSEMRIHVGVSAEDQNGI
jgi:hypothetical protein